MRPITLLPDIELPVIQAPMAGVQDEELAIAVSTAGGLGSMPCALLESARLEVALRRFASHERPINLNFFCHEMSEPDEANEARWRQALKPYYLEFGIEPPAPSTAGARRPIDAATVDLLEAFRSRVVSFHFGLPVPALLERIKKWVQSFWLQPRQLMRVSGWNVTALTSSLPKASKRVATGGHFLSDDLTLQSTTAGLVAALSKLLSADRGGRRYRKPRRRRGAAR